MPAKIYFLSLFQTFRDHRPLRILFLHASCPSPGKLRSLRSVSQSPNQSIDKTASAIPFNIIIHVRHETRVYNYVHLSRSAFKPNSRKCFTAGEKCFFPPAAVQRSLFAARSGSSGVLSCRTRHPNQVTPTLKPTVSLRTADDGKAIPFARAVHWVRRH